MSWTHGKMGQWEPAGPIGCWPICSIGIGMSACWCCCCQVAWTMGKPAPWNAWCCQAVWRAPGGAATRPWKVCIALITSCDGCGWPAAAVAPGIQEGCWRCGMPPHCADPASRVRPRVSRGPAVRGDSRAAGSPAAGCLDARLPAPGLLCWASLLAASAGPSEGRT